MIITRRFYIFSGDQARLTNHPAGRDVWLSELVGRVVKGIIAQKLSVSLLL